MANCRSTPLVAATAALGVVSFSAQAFASAENEYTLSASEALPTVTTLQPVGQAQIFQPQPAAPAASPFGELVYDTQPYMPDAQTSQDGTYVLEPYNSTADTQPYQIESVPSQPIYMPVGAN